MGRTPAVFATSRDDAIREAIGAHACGLKVHEDTGATLRTIDTALRVADHGDLDDDADADRSPA